MHATRAFAPLTLLLATHHTEGIMAQAPTLRRLQLDKETLRAFVGRGPQDRQPDYNTFSGECGNTNCTEAGGGAYSIGCVNCGSSSYCSTTCCKTTV